MKYLSVEDIRELGILQEANRFFFHPLGLALEVDLEHSVLRLQDWREAPEGVIFSEGVMEASKYNLFQAFRLEHHANRFNKLGFVQQPPPSEDGIDGEVTSVAGSLTCGRRFDYYAGGIPAHTDRRPMQDRWRKFKNGNRVCSYCGSLHPDDFFELVKQAAEASDDVPYGTVPEIEPSDKSYKIYVHQPGIMNAGQGGIKFYTQHLPVDHSGKEFITPEQAILLSTAIRATRRRLQIKTHGIKQ